MGDSSWLQELKAGDEVFATARLYGTTKAAITKVTATQIVIRDCRYRKSDGGLVGSSAYSDSCIHPLTDENVAASFHRGVCKQTANKIIRSTEGKPLAVLREAEELLKEALAKLIDGNEREKSNG